MPPLKSCSWEPEPGSKRSTQMKPNVPLSRRVPSAATYVPFIARMSVSRS